MWLMKIGITTAGFGTSHYCVAVPDPTAGRHTRWRDSVNRYSMELTSQLLQLSQCFFQLLEGVQISCFVFEVNIRNFPALVYYVDRTLVPAVAVVIAAVRFGDFVHPPLQSAG